MAAVARIWATVTTPVPPTPASRMSTVSVLTMATGAPSAASWPGSGVAAGGVSGSTATVMKLGQSPSRQLASRLHDVWSIVVLVPSGVSRDWTDRQLETSPQSPHPSQRRWLMTTRKPGVVAFPRLRSRRVCAAHAWSWMSTVTPSTAASASCASTMRVLSHTLTPAGISTLR